MRQLGEPDHCPIDLLVRAGLSAFQIAAKIISPPDSERWTGRQSRQKAFEHGWERPDRRTQSKLLQNVKASVGQPPEMQKKPQMPHDKVEAVVPEKQNEGDQHRKPATSNQMVILIQNVRK
jgi:hypothetical protein